MNSTLETGSALMGIVEVIEKVREDFDRLPAPSSFRHAVLGALSVVVISGCGPNGIDDEGGDEVADQGGTGEEGTEGETGGEIQCNFDPEESIFVIEDVCRFPSYPTCNLIVTDYDNDGKLDDIVTGDGEEMRVRIGEGSPAQPQFSPPQEILYEYFGHFPIDIADLNLDGIGDLGHIDRHGNSQPFVSFGMEQGGYEEKAWRIPILNNGGEEPNGLEYAHFYDFNGDTKPDILAVYNSSVRFYANKIDDKNLGLYDVLNFDFVGWIDNGGPAYFVRKPNEEGEEKVMAFSHGSLYEIPEIPSQNPMTTFPSEFNGFSSVYQLMGDNFFDLGLPGLVLHQFNFTGDHNAATVILDGKGERHILDQFVVNYNYPIVAAPAFVLMNRGVLTAKRGSSETEIVATFNQLDSNGTPSQREQITFNLGDYSIEEWWHPKVDRGQRINFGSVCDGGVFMLEKDAIVIISQPME